MKQELNITGKPFYRVKQEIDNKICGVDIRIGDSSVYLNLHRGHPNEEIEPSLRFQDRKYKYEVPLFSFGDRLKNCDEKEKIEKRTSLNFLCDEITQCGEKILNGLSAETQKNQRVIGSYYDYASSYDDVEGEEDSLGKLSKFVGSLINLVTFGQAKRKESRRVNSIAEKLLAWKVIEGCCEEFVDELQDDSHYLLGIEENKLGIMVNRAASFYSLVHGKAYGEVIRLQKFLDNFHRDTSKVFNVKKPEVDVLYHIIRGDANS